MNVGVPQSLIIVPLPFSLYINRSAAHMEGRRRWWLERQRRQVTTLLSCRHLQIYLRVSINQLKSGVTALTIMANRIYEWTGASALKLNAFQSKQMICGFRDFVDSIYQNCLASKWAARYTCPIREDSRKPQVKAVAKKVNHTLYTFKFFCHLTTFKWRKRLVYTLALSYINNRVLKHTQWPTTFQIYKISVSDTGLVFRDIILLHLLGVYWVI